MTTTTSKKPILPTGRVIATDTKKAVYATMAEIDAEVARRAAAEADRAAKRADEISTKAAMRAPSGSVGRGGGSKSRVRAKSKHPGGRPRVHQIVRDEYFCVRFTKDEAEKLRLAARERGISQAELLHEYALQAHAARKPAIENRPATSSAA